MTARPETLWRDPDRRRALLLSVLIHALALFLLIWLWSWPRTPPTPAFIVIDVGTPALADVPVDAPTVGDPAPQAPVPQVADPQTGEPQAPAVETPTPTRQPEPQAETRQPEPSRVEAAAAAEAPPPPAPQVRVPEPTVAAPPVDIPLADAPPSSALPEIDEVRLEPRPLTQAIVLPTPAVTAIVPEARVITATPSVQVTPERALPQPEVQVAVAEARPLDVTPQVEVAAVRSVEVTPQVQVAEPRSLAVVPQVEVIPTRSLAVTPRVEVAAAVAVPDPSVTVEVRLPAVAEAVAEEPAVEAPPGPQETLAVVQEPGGADESAASQAVSQRELNRPAGGNADQAGQTRDQADASLEGLGAAAGPTGAATPTGVPASRALEPYSDQRFRPLVVVLDNANGYPQAGFLEASAIYEFPVEGGLTRLMTIYDRIDPASVGPVRSARDYMIEATRNLDGILVHDGGAPSAMNMIATQNLTTLNAYNRGELFSRAGGRSAPYNLFSSGRSLRQAVNTLNLERVRNLRTQRYRPAEDADAATAVQVRYSGAYLSGFTYNPVLNHYRWQRNGQNASDAGGQSVVVDAVVIARIIAQPIPDDPFGRLYIRLAGGGEATLLLRGKVIEGRWSERNGVSFYAHDGEQIDLAPFKHWVMFVPGDAQVTIE